MTRAETLLVPFKGCLFFDVAYLVKFFDTTIVGTNAPQLS